MLAFAAAEDALCRCYDCCHAVVVTAIVTLNAKSFRSNEKKKKENESNMSVYERSHME